MSHFYLHNTRDKQYPLEVTSDAANPSVSLSDAKEFLREDRSVEDSLITSLISASEELLEDYTGYVLIDTDYTLYLGSFEDIKIPKKPLQSGSISIKYDDEDGNEQSLASSDYTIYEQESPVRIEFESGLPELYDDNDYPVRVEFTVGYGTDESSVPDNLKTAVKVICMFLHMRNLPEDESENLNPLDIKAVKALIGSNKIGRFK